MDDNEAIKRYRSGDADALSELVERYRRPLYGFLLQMTEGQDDVDEIFQEVWFRAIRALDRYQERNRFISWLFKIAHRLIIDRARQRKPALPLDSPESERGLFEAGVATGRHPAAPLENQELGVRIRAAVAQLPQRQREVFLMRMEAELPFKDIARIQKTSINTALARMAYAMDKLRHHLSDAYQELA